MPRKYSSLDGIIARSGRATEDPVEMTREANETRIAKYIAAAIKDNPDLTPLQAARAGRQLLRADMARMAKKSAAVRAERAAQSA